MLMKILASSVKLQLGVDQRNKMSLSPFLYFALIFSLYGQEDNDKKGEMDPKRKSKIKQPRCPKAAGVVPTFVVQ